MISFSRNREKPYYDFNSTWSAFDRFVEQILKPNFNFADGSSNVSFSIKAVGKTQNKEFNFVAPALYFTMKDCDIRQFIPEFDLEQQEALMMMTPKVIIEASVRDGSNGIGTKKFIIMNDNVTDDPDFISKADKFITKDGLRLRPEALNSEGAHSISVVSTSPKCMIKMVPFFMYILDDQTTEEMNQNNEFVVHGPSNLPYAKAFDKEISYVDLYNTQKKVNLAHLSFEADASDFKDITVEAVKDDLPQNPTSMAIGWRMRCGDNTQFFHGFPQKARFGNKPISEESILAMMAWLVIAESYIFDDDYHDAIGDEKEVYDNLKRYLRVCQGNTYLMDFELKLVGNYYVADCYNPLTFIDKKSVIGDILYNIDATLTSLKYRGDVWSEGDWTPANAGCHVLALAHMYSKNMVLGACKQGVASWTGVLRGLANICDICEQSQTPHLMSGKQSLGKSMAQDVVIQETYVAKEDLKVGCDYLLWRHKEDRSHFMICSKTNSGIYINYDPMNPSQGFVAHAEVKEFEWDYRKVESWSATYTEDGVILAKYDGDNRSVVPGSEIRLGKNVDITTGGHLGVA